MSSAPQLSRDETPIVSFLKRPWVPPALLAALVCLVYVGALRFEFVYDDNFQVVDNPWLTWHFIPRYFTQHVWAFAGVSGVYWRPLFLLWFLLQHALFGVNPAGWHAATIALHAVVTSLVYFLARRLSGDPVTAALAALIFGLHPALIESVAWISGSSDSLLAVFFVSTFLAHLNWRRQRSAARLAAALGLYALALMSKEPAVVLLGIIAAYAWIYAGPSPLGKLRAAVSEVAPYLPLTLVYGVVHWFIFRRLDYGAYYPATLARTLLTIPSLLWFYARMLVLPWPISPEYNLKLVSHFGLTSVLLPALALLAIAAMLYLWTRRLLRRGERDVADIVRFACVWIILPLLPVLWVKPLSPQDFAHARYLYLSCMGFGLLVALLIRRLPAGSSELFRLPATQSAAAAALVVALAAATATQQLYWASNLLLFSRGVSVAPQNPIALTGLGLQLSKRKDYPKAIALLQEALRQDPNDWHPNFSLGYTYFVLERYEEAERLFLRAVTLHPSDADPDQYIYLAMTENRLGKIAEAEWAIRQAVLRRPQRERYRYAMALVLEQEGKMAEAAREFQATLAINPGNADARVRLARLQQSSVIRP
jgi:tetratricopeptide (TPR) repeat protein